MDMIKIGRYIAQKRKECGLTQVQLAEKLNMSDKSVSKWERGVCFPDVSVYMKLCEILGITLNEFIAGEDLEEQNIIAKSEDNIIQITSDGIKKRRKLKNVIVILAIIVTVIIANLVGVIYFQIYTPKNYILAFEEDSTEMETAQMLSGIDGVYLFGYNLEQKYQGVTVNLSTYVDGKIVSKVDMINTEFSDESVAEHNGVIAVIPDFDNYKVKLIVTGDSAKISTEFPILEGVEDREWYGRSGQRIHEMITIEEETEKGIVALYYDNDELQSVPIESIENGEISRENDYMYYLSIKFY